MWPGSQAKHLVGQAESCSAEWHKLAIGLHLSFVQVAVHVLSLNTSTSSGMQGMCINARADPNATHVPFRDSKLTRLLQVRGSISAGGWKVQGSGSR